MLGEHDASSTLKIHAEWKLWRQLLALSLQNALGAEEGKFLRRAKAAQVPVY